MPTLRRSLGLILSASVVAMALLLGTAATPAAAVTCSVPSGTYPTIQSAVDDDDCDTIVVAAGPYTESVLIDRPLTLLGPNAGDSGLGARGLEATVTSAGTTFDVQGPDVTIDGFTINGDFGVFVQRPGAVVENNIITGTSRALSLDFAGDGASVLDNDIISNSRSLHVSAGNKTNVEINRNRFSGPLAGTGIFFSGNFSIAGFDFSDNQVLHLANIAANISDGTVNGNTFDVVLPGTLSVQISLHNSTVTENTFEGDDANACLQLFGSQFGLVPSDHVTISDNTFTDCGAPTANYAIQLSPDIHDILITNNVITNGLEGVNTRDVTPWSVAGLNIHINFNNITDNTSFGVRNGQMGVLDAECNWWGAADGPGPVGPGSGDNVSENVDFTPWLIAQAPGGACAGGLPSGGTVTGGGQVPVDDGTASFGFSANATRERGHLEYVNHANRDHLNCTVDVVVILSATKAHLEGTCSSRSAADSFTAEVEDNAEPGRDADKFEITYDGNTEGGTLINGNIRIESGPAAAASSESNETAATGAGEGALPSGATFSGIALSGLEVGTGVSIASDGAAAGQFVAVLLGTSLLGQPQEIEIDGEVGGGSIGPDGSATFSGSATVDLGDGSVPLLNVPFSVTATTESLIVKLDASTLPSATVNAGSITIGGN